MDVIVWVVGLAALAGVAYVLLVAFAGVGAPPPPPSSAPRVDAEALARLQALDASPDVAEACRTALYEPEGPARATIVYLHGFTNCPHQFTPTAHLLASRGYRVLVPRQPHHGLKDLQNREIAGLTSAELVEHVGLAIDAAASFPEPVYVFGLSGGGVLAYWAAATRTEVEYVAAAGPFAAPKGVPLPLGRVLVRFHSVVPKIWMWWDPRKKEALGESPYVYPGLWLPSITPYLHLANTLADHKVTPHAGVKRAVVLSNPGDFAVRRDAAVRLLRRTFAGHAAVTRELTLGDLGWWHDFIDQDGPHHGSPEQVADIVLALLGQAEETAGGLVVDAKDLS